MLPTNRSLTMPRRKSDSCVAMLLAVALALPCTNSLLGMERMRIGPGTAGSRYRNPSTLPGLRVELMCPPLREYCLKYGGDGQNVSSHEQKAVRGMHPGPG